MSVHEFMNLEQAEKYTCYSKSYLRALVRQGKIPCYKTDNSQQGKILFCKNELEQWILRGRKATYKELHEQAESILNGGVK